jgi:DNA repair photolyase
MPVPERPAPKGRGSRIQPPNPYLPRQVEDDFEHLAEDDEYFATLERPPTEYFPDDSQSIVASNSSPDVPFTYSINPYRGCAHGCSYCYARPSHEFLGLSAGLDFETKVFVKFRAPELLREWLARDAWTGESIAFSGVTDCYQPAEREFRLTRGCLEVAAACGQPIGIITKNALVTRDLDLLSPMAAQNTVHVAVSITTLDAHLARVLEPRTSSPEARLRAIRELSAAGVTTFVMLAPVIPGLNDSEIPAILEAAADAGAASAGYTLLRLPGSVQPVFSDWLARHLPDRKDLVQSRIRQTHGGQLNDAEFGRRMRGTGNWADQIKQTFAVFKHKHHLDKPLEPLSTAHFRHPVPRSGQLRLF